MIVGTNKFMSRMVLPPPALTRRRPREHGRNSSRVVGSIGQLARLPRRPIANLRRPVHSIGHPWAAPPHGDRRPPRGNPSAVRARVQRPPAAAGADKDRVQVTEAPGLSGVLDKVE